MHDLYWMAPITFLTQNRFVMSTLYCKKQNKKIKSRVKTGVSFFSRFSLSMRLFYNLLELSVYCWGTRALSCKDFFFQDIISDSRCSINVGVIALWFKDTGYNSLFRFYPAGERREFLVVPCWDKTGENTSSSMIFTEDDDFSAVSLYLPL